MADTYTPGLQFQNWASLPSLTESIMSGNFAKTPLGMLAVAALGSTYGKDKKESVPEGAIIPEENKQNWGNVPSSQLGVPPINSMASPLGLKPISISAQAPTMQTSMDSNRLKDSLWE